MASRRAAFKRRHPVKDRYKAPVEEGSVELIYPVDRSGRELPAQAVYLPPSNAAIIERMDRMNELLERLAVATEAANKDTTR